MSPAVHVPIFLDEQRDGKPIRIYRKTEKDDNFYYHNECAISIMEKYLRQCAVVRIEIPHRSVVVEALSQDILDGNIKRFHKAKQTDEPEWKYYHRITKWDVVSGDKEWCDKVFAKYPPKK